MEDKPWYQSKTMWSAILFVVIAVLKAYDAKLKAAGIIVPYEELAMALASLGLWGLRDAQGKVIVSGGKKK